MQDDYHEALLILSLSDTWKYLWGREEEDDFWISSFAYCNFIVCSHTHYQLRHEGRHGRIQRADLFMRQVDLFFKGM